MQQHHGPKDPKTYHKGLNSDVNKELSGVNEGEYVDALNMRNLSQDGNNAVSKKVKGEELLYPAIDNRCFLPVVGNLSSTYECMLTLEIQDNILEAWASTDPVNNPPFFRVNGQIVCMSSNLPISLSYPLQYDKNENCNTGEFYITNNNTPPMVFSLRDMMENSGMIGGQCTQKYFSDFQIDDYTVNIAATLHKPLYIKSDSGSSGYDFVFGASGLPVGSYSYSYRYVTPEGDRSNWSPITELIPVAFNVMGLNVDPIHQGRRTYSKDPDISSPSVYGNHVRFRIENEGGFESIEIRRDSWYSGSAIGTPPVSEIIGLALISTGVSVLEILDRCGADEVEEAITIDEQLNQTTAISRAKSIRYYNERLYLMNIGYASKDIDEQVEFTDQDNIVYPTIQKIGKLGHKSPYNAAHFKSNMRGDRVGFGIAVWDANGNISYVKKIDGAENFTFPNRREAISGLTSDSSYYGTVRAANIDGSVSQTHEVFDHANAVSKSGGLLSSNIIQGSPGNVGWNPINPVSQNDSLSDHDKVVNYRVSQDNVGSWKNYNPRAFGIDYYSLGVAVKGIDLSGVPWASGFSIVQTESVQRVVAQGLGFYKMNKAGGMIGANGTKDTDKFWVYFPDLDESTGINPAIVEDIKNNFGGGQYKIQLVSPLGYFSEVFSFESQELPLKNQAADLITYCRILNDNGQINPDGFGVALPGSAGSKFVGYGAGMVNNPPSVFSGNSGGNQEFVITGFNDAQTATANGKYFEVQLSNPIYSMFGAGGPIDADHPEVKKWQEPVYVINIIKTTAEVVDGNTTQYKYTGHYIKKESVVGIGTGSNLNLKIVSERWEDCTNKLSNHTVNGFQNLERFIWVEDEFGIHRRWVNVTYKSQAEIDVIANDLQANGVAVITESGTGIQFEVYGMFKNTETQIGQDSFQRGVNLVFEQFTGIDSIYHIPAQGRKIYVKYDNRIPVRVFGGDTWINESVWACVDVQYNKNCNLVNASDEFTWNMPMPYRRYDIPDSVRIVRSTTGVNRIQNNNTFNFQRAALPSAIRQWVLMWTAETRVNLSFAFNDEGVKHSIDQFFPLKNYVMHPYRWRDNEFSSENDVDIYDDNNIWDDYAEDYGSEWRLWGYGGFRFRPQTNIDYSKSQTTLLLTSTPEIGFDEQTDYCTRVIWSEKRPVNAQFTPTVRTFPANNFYDLSDDTGEIKFAWSSLSSDKGNNLYAITDGGIALLLVDKRIIHEINANELATVGSDIGGILNHLWIDKSVGMRDQTWRSWAEYSNMLFFHNRSSAYMFVDNQLINITDKGWKEVFLKRIAPYIGDGYSTKLCGVYNVLTKEYIMNFDKSMAPKDITNELIPQSAIYGVPQEMLQCRSTYNYDKYLSFSSRLLGMKDGQTYTLGVGNQIAKQDMQCYLVGLSNQDVYFDKEFIRIRVNSSSKPKRIEFFSNYEEYLSNSPASIVDADVTPLAIKDYHGYECFVPRRTVAPHFREQGRTLLFKIVSEEDEDFLIASTVVQYKRLK